MRTLLLLLLLIWALPATAAENTATEPGSVPVVAVAGVIGPAQAEWIQDELRRAAAEGAPAVILRINTPGGLTQAMRRINEAILDSPVPVIAWVPPGGRATSAGTYILYAAHVAAMAPGTHLGAATPVQMGSGSPLPGGNEEGSEKEGASTPGDTKERKAVSDAAAYIRGLADLRGRNGEWAERAVREAVSLTAEEALAEGVIDLVAATPGAVLDATDGREVAANGTETRLDLAEIATETRTPDWRTRLLQALSNPNVAYILMLIGIYGLIFELASPGAIVPGVLGGISLLLALYGFQALPVSYAGLGLIGLGMLLFVAEALVPSFGALGLGGLVSFVLGSIMLMDTGLPALTIAWPVIGTAAVVTGAFLLAVATMAARGHHRRTVSGADHLIGATATAEEALDPDGHVRVQGELWRARSESPVEAGDRVQIQAVAGLTLHVAPLAAAPTNRKKE